MTVTVSGSDITFADASVQSSAANKIPVTYRTTETSDVALATCASGGTQVGSNISVEIPTSGFIRVTMVQGQVSNTDGSGQASMGIAIDVNGTTYFEDGYISGTTAYAPGIEADSSGPYLSSNGLMYCYYGTGHSRIPSVLFDISGRSIATGSQTLKVLMGDSAYSARTANGQVDGATKTAVFEVEIIEI